MPAFCPVRRLHLAWIPALRRGRIVAATNHVIACCANSAASGLFDAYANITLMVPEKLREIKLRQMTEAAAGQAEETGIPILGCNVQVLPMVTETVAVCVISAGMKNRSESPLVPIRKQPLVDRDLVMTKWLGLEGTAVIAAASREKLCGRYPSDLVDTAAEFYQYLSVAPEAATAVKSGRQIICWHCGRAVCTAAYGSWQQQMALDWSQT